jgi:hypothetical protein
MEGNRKTAALLAFRREILQDSLLGLDQINALLRTCDSSAGKRSLLQGQQAKTTDIRMLVEEALSLGAVRRKEIVEHVVAVRADLSWTNACGRVSRVLKRLQAEGAVTKIDHGLWVASIKSRRTDRR